VTEVAWSTPAHPVADAAAADVAEDEDEDAPEDAGAEDAAWAADVAGADDVAPAPAGARPRSSGSRPISRYANSW
jgi:hypothetical protein